MAKAAIKSHAPALYSLAVIQFNGSGGSKNDKDLRAGVALSARAAFLGHIDALRELGHCFQDGYGVPQNVPEGRRFLVQANARELAAVLSVSNSAVQPDSWLAWKVSPGSEAGCCPLLSDFGCNVPAPEPHPASRFITEWFAARGGVPGPGSVCAHMSDAGDPRRGSTSFGGVLFVGWSTIVRGRVRHWIGKCNIRWSAHPWNGGSTEMVMGMVTVSVSVTVMRVVVVTVMRVGMPMWKNMMVWLRVNFDFGGLQCLHDCEREW